MNGETEDSNPQMRSIIRAGLSAGTVIGLFFIFIHQWLSSSPFFLKQFIEQTGLLGAYLYSLGTTYVAFIPAALISGVIFNKLHRRGYIFAFFTCLASSAIVSPLYQFVAQASIKQGITNSILSLIFAAILTMVIALIFTQIYKRSSVLLIVVSIVICGVSIALIPVAAQYRETTQTNELLQAADEKRSSRLYMPSYAFEGYKLVQAGPSGGSILDEDDGADSYELTYSTHKSWNTNDALYSRYKLTLYSADSSGFSPPNNCAEPDPLASLLGDDAETTARPCKFYTKVKTCEIYESTSEKSALYCQINSTVIKLKLISGSSIPMGNRPRITVPPLKPTFQEIEQLFESLTPATTESIQSQIQT